MYDNEVLNHENNFVLHNFIEDKFYKPGKNLKRDKIFKVINVGNLRPEKEHLFLIRAFSKLPPREFQLTIVGDGILKVKLTDLIAKFNSSNIRLVDSCTDISDVLIHNDMLVSCSSFEGFGIATVEAMAKGLPCLLSDISAHKEIMGDHGLYFSVLNENDFIRKITSISKDENIYNEQRALSLVRSKLFSKDHYMEKLTRIYKKHIT
jgi:glycosyltransferase involved in cell wall biosynthesis